MTTTSRLNVRWEYPFKSKTKDYVIKNLAKHKALDITKGNKYSLLRGEVVIKEGRYLLYNQDNKPSLEVLERARESCQPTTRLKVVHPSGKQEEVFGWSQVEVASTYGLNRNILTSVERGEVYVVQVENKNTKHKWSLGTIVYSLINKPSQEVLEDTLLQVSRGNLGLTKVFTLRVEFPNGKTQDKFFGGRTPNQDAYEWGLQLNALASIKKGGVFRIKGDKHSLGYPKHTLIYGVGDGLPKEEEYLKAKQEIKEELEGKPYFEVRVEDKTYSFKSYREALKLINGRAITKLRSGQLYVSPRDGSVKGYPKGTIVSPMGATQEEIDKLKQEVMEEAKLKEKKSTKQPTTIRVEMVDGSTQDYTYLYRKQGLDEMGLGTLVNSGKVFISKHNKRKNIPKYALVYTLDEKRKPKEETLRQAREKRDGYVQNGDLERKPKTFIKDVIVTHLDGEKEVVKNFVCPSRLYNLIKDGSTFEVRNKSKFYSYGRGTKIALANQEDK